MSCELSLMHNKNAFVAVAKILKSLQLMPKQVFRKHTQLQIHVNLSLKQCRISLSSSLHIFSWHTVTRVTEHAFAPMYYTYVFIRGVSSLLFSDFLDNVYKIHSWFLFFFLFIFTQDSLFSAYCTVINEGPAIKVLIVCKAPI